MVFDCAHMAKYCVKFFLSNWFTRQYSRCVRSLSLSLFVIFLPLIATLSVFLTLSPFLSICFYNVRAYYVWVPYGLIIAWHGAIFNFALRRKQNTINNHHLWAQTMAKIRTTASRVHLLTSRCGAIPELRSRRKRATVLVCQRSSALSELCVCVRMILCKQAHKSMEQCNEPTSKSKENQKQCKETANTLL